MNIELIKKDLENLVRGTCPNYHEFENPLVKKAGHSYSDQYGRTSWNTLSVLTEGELYELYKICTNSWI
jgi:hypothetical protein